MKGISKSDFEEFFGNKDTKLRYKNFAMQSHHTKKYLWIHGASVGEIKSIESIVQKYRK